MVDITFAFGFCLYSHPDALEEAAKLTEEGFILFFVHLTFFSSEAWGGGGLSFKQNNLSCVY